MLDLEQRRDPSGLDSRVDSKRPILVTGAPRSGSTWVGNVLSLDRDSGYIYEPFNKNCPPGQCRARFHHAFTYVTAENEDYYLDPMRDTLAWKYSHGAEMRRLRTPRDFARMARDLTYFQTMRQRNARVVLKDPLAVFSSDWIASRFDARVVVVIRHPAAFVASLRAAGWHHVPFEVFRDQPQLMEERLAPFRDRILAACETPLDGVASGCLLWNMLHYHISLLASEHPDWIFVRHEDLSRDPEHEFRAVFDRLGLDFSPAVENDLKQYTEHSSTLGRLSLYHNRRATRQSSMDSITRFRKRLSPDEITDIRRATASMADRFYSAQDWQDTS